jgi:hypothetical protein
MATESPCLTCKAKKAKDCSSTTCLAWRSWFLPKWEETRELLFNIKGKPPVRPQRTDCIVVGGFKYYHPDMVRAQMRKEETLLEAERKKTNTQG